VGPLEKLEGSFWGLNDLHGIDRYFKEQGRSADGPGSIGSISGHALLKAGDQVALFSFASKVELLEELTSERQRVANRIGGITAGGVTKRRQARRLAL
jgi:hypothetical protein